MTDSSTGPLRDPAVHAVIDQVRAGGRPPGGGAGRGGGQGRPRAGGHNERPPRDPANGFVGMSLPLKGGTELSVLV